MSLMELSLKDKYLIINELYWFEMTILAKVSFMLDNYWTNIQIYGIFLMTKAITMLLNCNFNNTVKKPELYSGQQVKIALLSTVKVF